MAGLSQGFLSRFLRYCFLIAVVFLFVRQMSAQTPGFQWVQSISGTNNDYGFGVAADAAGNSYATAWFYSPTVQVGNLTLTNSAAGLADIYVVKYSPSGNVIWAKQAGGSGSDTGIGVAADNVGNCYVTGAFTGAASFGSTNLNATGGTDIFLAKYDGSGNVVWVTQAGGSGADTGHGIALDGNGNIYVSGQFTGTANFGATNLISQGGLDGFVAKYNSNGGFVWVQQFAGTSGDDYGYRIASDASGKTHLVGTFFSTVLTAGTFSITNNGVRDIFIAELNSQGDITWLKGAGGTSDDQGFNIAVDQNGNSYITGFFKTTANFGNNVSITSRGFWDAFVAKFDGTGTALWATNMGGINYNDFGNGIVVDAFNNVYVSGTFYGTSKFGDTTLNAGVAFSDIFVARLNSAGSILNVWQAGNAGTDDGQCIAADAKGNLYLAGYCEVSGYFGDLKFVGKGGLEAFVAKIETELHPLKEPWFELARSAGGSTNDNGFGLAIDVAGYTYVTGNFYGTANFGTTNLVSYGASDVFLAKYDPLGNLVWVRQAGSTNDASSGSSGDVSYKVAVDSSTNIFITGYFSGTIDFGTATLTSTGRNETYLAKYNRDGTLLWARRSGGAYHDTGLQVRVDAAGNAYMAGFFRNVATFGTNTLTAAASSPSNLKSDMYLTKYDANGNNVWAVGGGGSGDDVSYDFAFDSSGNILVSGYFENTATFSATNLTSVGDHDLFVAKYNSSGSLLWIRQAGGIGVEIARAIAVDSAGNSFIAGNFQSTISFGTTNLTSAGSDDILFAKYDANGNLLWAKRAGGTGSDIAMTIVLDRAGNVYLGGLFSGFAMFDGQSMTATGSDIFIACYNSDGQLNWVKQAGGSGSDELHCLALDNRGRLEMTGAFSANASFDSISLNSSGLLDIFYARLGETPRLQSSYDNNGVSLSWPVLSTGFVLQSNNSLDPAGWNNVSMAAEATNGINTVTEGFVGNRFYRLKK